jgi:hypothetical protein
MENIQQERREADIRELPYSNCMTEGNRNGGDHPNFKTV